MKYSKNRKKYEEAHKEKYEDLKGEIRKLRKEVSQLRKENSKLRGRDEQIQDLFEDFETEKETVEPQHSCPKCANKNVKILEKLRGNKDYMFCENPYCNYRGPIK